METNLQRMARCVEMGLIKPIIVTQDDEKHQGIELTKFGYEISVFLNFTRDYPDDIVKAILKEYDNSIEELKVIQDKMTEERNTMFESEEEHIKGKLWALKFVLDLLKNEIANIKENEQIEKDLKL